MDKIKNKIKEEDGVVKVTTTIDNGDFGKRNLTFETGRLAGQAAGAVTVNFDDETMLLATTAYGNHPKESFDFFPLTVDVEERMYAVGKIPGSFFRREARPTTDAILASRLIDRPLRPMFKDGLRNEVQVVITVLSLDPQEFYDVIAINGASAATTISGLPFEGPVSGVRMALIPTKENKNGTWVAFPSAEQLNSSVFSIVIAGRKILNSEGNQDVAIIMVEAESSKDVISLVADGAKAPTEEVVAAGLEAAKPFIAQLCDAQQDLAKKSAKEISDFELFPPYSDEIFEKVSDFASEKLVKSLSIQDKDDREKALDELKISLIDKFSEEYPDDLNQFGAAFRSLMKKNVREKILKDGFRIDGRGVKDIRALSAEVSIIPRTHGSALFQRGETQILGVTTLNVLSMSQQLDSLTPETTKRYMHHYNFPPYSTGEPGRVGSPKRREIGHGALAERALIPVIPSESEFPYAIRQVSEALSSNGSTSMGSVCASTLSLLNAGVPIKAPVAGIAMGLVSGEINGSTKYVTLTDILGAEDAFGDMDFKVAGTKDFITALQLDTKLNGIPSEVLSNALLQAKEARNTILDVMAAVITGPDSMSDFAPRIETISIPVDKIGELIGPKGKNIKAISEESGAEINIEENGTVFIASVGEESLKIALNKINELINPRKPEIGEEFLGKVVKTTTFGAFVSLLPGADGLLHISKLGKGKRVAKVEDVIKEGDEVKVVVKEIDDRNKISLDLV